MKHFLQPLFTFFFKYFEYCDSHYDDTTLRRPPA